MTPLQTRLVEQTARGIERARVVLSRDGYVSLMNARALSSLQAAQAEYDGSARMAPDPSWGRVHVLLAHMYVRAGIALEDSAA